MCFFAERVLGMSGAFGDHPSDRSMLHHAGSSIGNVHGRKSCRTGRNRKDGDGEGHGQIVGKICCRFQLLRSGIQVPQLWLAGISVTSKKSPNVYKKWPKTDFTRKWKILTPLPNCPKMWQFGENNCFHSLRKVGQSAINRPIWSHWLECLTLIRLCVRIPLQLQDKWGQLYQN